MIFLLDLKLKNKLNIKRKLNKKIVKVEVIVSKTRLKFSNSKIPYKNTWNNFFVYFSKEYVKKQKFQKKYIYEFGPFLKKL